ncbi:hypothetical protein SDC9_169821 [bioreactor metagenome]|uniref:Uncharacterized protein n=1 Tax=bioreactor metagenome TaxID=1076179 RepID=A0A645G6D7_9ZZZZ
MSVSSELRLTEPWPVPSVVKFISKVALPLMVKVATDNEAPTVISIYGCTMNLPYIVKSLSGSVSLALEKSTDPLSSK